MADSPEFILPQPIVVKIQVGMNPAHVLTAVGVDLAKMRAAGHRVDDTVQAIISDASGQLRLQVEASNLLLAKMEGQPEAYFFVEFAEGGGMKFLNRASASEYEKCPMPEGYLERKN